MSLEIGQVAKTLRWETAVGREIAKRWEIEEILI